MSDAPLTNDAMAITEKPTGQLRWYRPFLNSPPRLQQYWNVQYWQHGCIYKQFQEWRDVPEEIGSVP